MSVELRVKTQIDDIIADFDRLNGKVREVQNTLRTSSQDVTDELNQNVKRTESFLGKMRTLGGRVADQLRSDFKSLVSINAVQSSLKISEQFKGSIAESVRLGDSIRKLGTTFQIASKDFTGFQSRMMRGLGEIGMSSTVASNTLEALASTPVRGEEALLEYSKTAGMVASLSGRKGQEGGIAKGIADVIQARGGNVNDKKEITAVAEDVRRVYNVTGANPEDTLKAMKDLFTSMPQEFRKTLSTRSLANLAAAGQVAGPNSTKFLQEFLGMSKIQRTALESQGFKGVFNDQGIDLDKFQRAANSVLSRIGGDPRMAAKTLGLTDEAADGFVRLAESMDKVKSAQDAVAKSTGSVTEQYKSSMGLSEAFSANINRVKGFLADPLSKGQQGLTDVLTSASESDAGAAATVAGGGLLAAVLAGAGLKGIGKGLGIGGLAKGAAVEGLTGREVQPVYVVNAAEIGGGMGLPGKDSAKGVMETIKGLGTKLLPVAAVAAKTAGVGLAGFAGYKIGEQVQEKLVEKTTGTTSEGFEGNAIERLIFKVDQLIGGQNAQGIMQAQQAIAQPPQRVIIETRSKDLRTTKPSRGANF